MSGKSARSSAKNNYAHDKFVRGVGTTFPRTTGQGESHSVCSGCHDGDAHSGRSAFEDNLLPQAQVGAFILQAFGLEK